MSKKRVKSYFTKSPKQPKIERMIFLIDDIDYIVTDTHLEARLLECQLIKELKPYFNSQMKNDRRYFYLNVTHSSHSRGLSIVLEREDRQLGPFRRKQVILLIDRYAHPPLSNCSGEQPLRFLLSYASRANEPGRFFEEQTDLASDFFRRYQVKLFHQSIRDLYA